MLQRQKILQNSVQTVTIALVRGNLHSHNLLHAVAHFDILINRNTKSDAIYNRCRQFDVQQFKQIDEAPLIFLPAKKKSNRTYYKPPKELHGGGNSSDDHNLPLQSHSYQFYDFIFNDTEILLPAKK